MNARSLIIAALLIGLGAAMLAGGPAHGQAPKRGGILNAMLGEDPPGFSIHEVATISGLWPVMPCYSNLVLFDQFKAHETAETVLPELAEKWSWQDNYRNLVFFLRRGVKWHDGHPFTSKDVKYTFDVVREAADAPAKLRLNPRKEWYANIDAIEAADPYTVVFRLKRPQPSLLLMLASGYSPVYPAHVPLAELRQRCIGTGPFRLKHYARGEMVELERNPEYFVTGRPYLDGIRYPIIGERGTRLAALQAGRLDLAMPLEMTKTMADTIKANAPSLVVAETGQIGSDNVIMNQYRRVSEIRYFEATA
jgi:peptide/nickel transport system substrate-binding protein